MGPGIQQYYTLAIIFIIVFNKIVVNFKLVPTRIFTTFEM